MAKGSPKSDWTVAFKDCHMLSWDGGYVTPDERVPAETQWDDDLEYVSYSRGRSSATVILRSLRSLVEYEMFLAEFMRLVPVLRDGKISGRFGFEKNGSNCGIYAVSA